MERSGRYLGALLILAALVAVGCSSDPEGVQPTTTTSPPDTTFDADEAPTPTVLEPDVESQPELVFDAPDPDPSLLGIDDDVRVGVLDNGLTYYVRSNNSPGSAVSLRLAVKAGGVNEEPLGTGAAHMLEHMMFNGTEKFPGNTLDAALRRIGAEIGPDFNAYTNDTETVYQLKVQDRGDNVDVAFDVLLEWASAATIDATEVAKEALVVREEIRKRTEAGGGVVAAAFDKIYHLETPYEGVSVAGTASTVNALTEHDLRDFYDTWYRPDNMAIIAVGDRSIDDLEDDIVERFSGLQARGEVTTPPETSRFELRSEPYVDILVEPSFGDSSVSVDIPMKAWDLNTIGGNQLELTETVLGIMINNRLRDGVDSGRLDLRRAGGGTFRVNRDLAYMGFNFDADDLEAGTEEFMTELQGSVQNPFSQRELDRAADVISSSQEQRRAEFGTKQDNDFANQLANHFLGGGDIASIDDSVDMVLNLLDELDIDEVNNHYGWIMTASEPIVVAIGPNAERVGDPEVHRAGVERASQATVGAFDDNVEEIDDLLAAPEAVDELSGRNLERNTGFEITFENGTRVLFAPSTIAESQVVLVSESPGGRAMLDADDGVVAGAAVSAVSASGIGVWDPIQIRRYLADLEVTLSPYIADFSEGFSGSAATSDLEVLFELLHLSLTEPRVDEVPFDQQVEYARDALDQVSLDSGTASDVAVADARTGGGSLAAAPTESQLDALTSEGALRIWNDRFGSLDEHVIVIVGDADPNEVLELARTWIGSLPAPGRAEDPQQPPLPGVVNERLSVGSGTAGGSYRLLSVGLADETIRNRVLADLATTVLNDRLFTVVREELGATYGGSARLEFSNPGEEIEVLVAIDGDPDRIDEIAETVLGELDDLRAGLLTTEDFSEAVAVLGSEYNFINNGFIIESLFDEAYQPLDRIIDRTQQRRALDGISRNDVTNFLIAAVSDTDLIDVRNVP